VLFADEQEADSRQPRRQLRRRQNRPAGRLRDPVQDHGNVAVLARRVPDREMQRILRENADCRAKEQRGGDQTTGRLGERGTG
jgi:hypothetical protein